MGYWLGRKEASRWFILVFSFLCLRFLWLKEKSSMKEVSSNYNFWITGWLMQLPGEWREKIMYKRWSKKLWVSLNFSFESCFAVLMFIGFRGYCLGVAGVDVSVFLFRWWYMNIWHLLYCLIKFKVLGSELMRHQPLIGDWGFLKDWLFEKGEWSKGCPCPFK